MTRGSTIAKTADPTTSSSGPATSPTRTRSPIPATSRWPTSRPGSPMTPARRRDLRLGRRRPQRAADRRARPVRDRAARDLDLHLHRRRVAGHDQHGRRDRHAGRPDRHPGRDVRGARPGRGPGRPTATVEVLDPATITIVKNLVGGTNATFHFDGDLGPIALPVLDTTASQSVPNLGPGTYSVTELATTRLGLHEPGVRGRDGRHDRQRLDRDDRPGRRRDRDMHLHQHEGAAAADQYRSCRSRRRSRRIVGLDAALAAAAARRRARGDGRARPAPPASRGDRRDVGRQAGPSGWFASRASTTRSADLTDSRSPVTAATKSAAARP